MNKSNFPRGTNGWFTIKNQSGDDPVEILIYDQIGKDWWTGEGIEAKAFAEALKTIPKSREIKLRINSPGGNVWDGLAIHNLLVDRKDKIVTIIDGVAASIASVIALSGRELKMPRNALMMIHDPWGVVQGTAEDMENGAEMLRKHRDSIASVYEGKTHMDPEEIRRMMKEETWMTGDDAKAMKFADTVTDEVILQASFDFSKFHKLPEQLKAVLNKQNEQNVKSISAARGGQPENKNQESLMNRAQIIALLNKHGVEVDENATDEELLAELENHLAEQKAKAEEKSGNVKLNADSDKPGDAQTADIASLRKELSEVTAHLASERRSRIESAVDACITEDRIPAAQRDKWVKRALGDESVLDDLRAMPARPPGMEPLGVIITGEAPRDIEKGLVSLRDPVKAWLRGNSIPTEVMAANAKAMAREIAKYRKKLEVILNANTIDADLKRNVILSDLMRAFKRKIVLANVFSTTYRNIPLEGTDKVTVPYYELDTATSSNFVAATGYTFTENTDTGSRDITIDKRKFKSMKFTSSEFRRQPYFQPNINMMLKAEQLALDVWLDVLSVITNANFGAAVLDVEPSAMDSDDVITIRKACQNADWPDVGRALVLGTDAEAALLSDDSVKHMMNIGSDMPVREGATGRIAGFEMFYSPRIPANSENLAGFAVLPPAILVATSPIAPTPGVRSQLLNYDLVVDPDLGVAFEYRYWGDADLDEDREVVECNYGYLTGNSAALKRVTNGAASQESSSSSSSSSASTTSVSSSSSTSSQSSSQSSLSSQG